MKIFTETAETIFFKYLFIRSRNYILKTFWRHFAHRADNIFPENNIFSVVHFSRRLQLLMGHMLFFQAYTLSRRKNFLFGAQTLFFQKPWLFVALMSVIEQISIFQENTSRRTFISVIGLVGCFRSHKI